MSINQRFKFIRKSLGLTQGEFAKQIGVKQNSISHMEKDGNTITDPVKLMLKSIFDININWLETGEGEMKLNSFKNEITPVPYDDYMMVEYVDLSVSAGYMGGCDVNLLPEKKKRLVPKEFEKGNYLVVRVDGDSMDNGTNYSIPNGTEVLVKELEQSLSDKLPIRNNLFVICSREGNVLKQIVEHNIEHEYVRCRSYNENYPDYNVPFDEIMQIFVYRKIVSMRPPIPDINSK
ncbi:XRE family transcriptional regulator [Sphingobacterium multivorum]|uniref:XRE family transcriptional regulator n=1 Tax=Sphingobacterium multivorum TaxID=28454 RepID=UPI0031BB5FC5